MDEKFVSPYAGEPWFEFFVNRQKANWERWHTVGAWLPGRIYFILAPRARAVKIGYTRGDPEKRLATLQTGCPEKLYLTGDMDGCPELEAMLHERWACNHLHGEWFSIDGNGIEEFLKDYDGTSIFCVPGIWPQVWGHAA